ncbi:MAG: DOMON domain-containing protein [Candidatus Bipolaricaulota bacterium]
MKTALLILVSVAVAAALAVFLLAPSAANPAALEAAPGVARTSPAYPSVDGKVDEGEYVGRLDLVGAELLFANDATTLRLAVVAPATGYVAVGLEPETMMQGADFLLGAVVDGVTVARDDWGTGLVSHAADVDREGSDDLLAAAGAESNGATTIEFAIPLDSGDLRDRVLRPGQTVKVLLAFHDREDSFSARHTRRASGTITLQAAP